MHWIWDGTVLNLSILFLNNRSLETDEAKNVLLILLSIIQIMMHYRFATAWQLIDNSMRCDYKGGLLQTAWCYLEEPENVKTNKRAELLENDEKRL